MWELPILISQPEMKVLCFQTQANTFNSLEKLSKCFQSLVLPFLSDKAYRTDSEVKGIDWRAGNHYSSSTYPFQRRDIMFPLLILHVIIHGEI